MELEDLVFIFLIIIIPMMLIVSYYIDLEAETIRIQIDYDGKLLEATKEAVEAFEINTTEWGSTYNSLANVKRRELLASINVFVTSLSTKLGIGGTAKEVVLGYIPAIVYTMYDGYYIYSPTYIPKSIVDEQNGLQIFYYGDIDRVKNHIEGLEFTTSATQSINGVIYPGKPIFEAAKNGTYGTYTYKNDNEDNSQTFNYTIERNDAIKEYKHILKTFVPYTTIIKNPTNNINYTINYTLDNYVRIFGKNSVGNIETKEGYIIKDYEKIIEISPNSISGVKYDGRDIVPEILTENIPIRDGENIKVTNYTYIYNSDGDKRYYDGENFFVIDSEYNKKNFAATDANSSLAEFKKILVKVNTLNDSDCVELYQQINPENPKDYKLYTYNKDEKKYEIYDGTVTGIPNIEKDCSATNYMVENYCFNVWFNQSYLKDKKVLENRFTAIKDNINENLNLSIANYSANSKMQYKLPDLSEEDWKQITSNVSMIAFFQGANIGLKSYNNYVVASSTDNNEFVGEDSIVFLDTEDVFHHKYGCSNAKTTIGTGGAYKTVDIKAQSFKNGFYYKHTKYNNASPQEASYGIKQCLYCIVNRNKMENTSSSSWKEIYYTALARERYIQMRRIRLTELE